MARRNRDMDDYELERRMRYVQDRREEDDDSVILLLIGIVVGIGVVGAGLGFLDHQFGWHLLDWFKGLLQIG